MPSAAHPTDELTVNLHATCVSVDGKGLLITGPSGSGKSSLALQLMAFGASLVSDDRVILTRNAERLRAEAPETLAGLIEARHVGILKSDYLEHVFIDAVVDMQISETKRLPEPHSTEILGLNLPCYYKSESPYFPAALMQLLKVGRHA